MLTEDFQGISHEKAEQDGKRIAVTMRRDFYTSADRVGARTYKSTFTYNVYPEALAEMHADKEEVGTLHYVYPNQLHRPIFDKVTVTAKITRPYTSNARDTFYLVDGEEITVPSNLAFFLTESGLAA